MSITGENGFLFSLDVVVAFLAMLLMLSLMLQHLEMAKEQQLGWTQRFALQRNAVMLIDSMVKNRDEKQPLLGSALYDEKKHRVLSNQLDLHMFPKAGQLPSELFFVSRLSLKAGSQEKTVLFQTGRKNCVSLDRIVLVSGKIGKVEAVVCEK